jgi:hypothetical protein
MGVFAKVALSLFVVVVGAVIAGVAKEMIGYGQYLVHLSIVLGLFYIWKK